MGDRGSADNAAHVIARVRSWLGDAAGMNLDGEDDLGVEPPPWVVETSGSTGVPKQVLLSRRAMLASAAASAERLGAGGAWLLALPPSYVAGLNVIVRSLVAGYHPVVLGSRGFAEAANELPNGVPAFVSLVPTQLRRLLDSDADVEALRGFRAVLLGGGPIDQELRARAVDLSVRTVATYGSAETCGGCVYDGVPLSGVEVEAAADGRLRIAGPVLADGYADPALTSDVFVDGWFLTSDAGSIEDGRLTVLGRVDDVVVSGGVNIPAPAVAARIREHPDVAACEVLGVSDPEWGNRLVAFITVDGPQAPELRDWVAAEHPRAWAPRQVVVLDSIPLLPNGKTDRMALKALADV